MIDTLKKDIAFGMAAIVANFRAAAELRSSFAIQTVGMMINNCSFVLIWVFFFRTFGEINGWSTPEVIGFQGVVAFAFGCAFGFFSGALHLPAIVNNGAFDALLLTPRSVMVRIITSSMRVSALGDLAYGVIAIVVYMILARIDLWHALMLASLMVPITIIFVSVGLITSLSSFFIPDAVSFARNLFEVFFSPSMYPSPLFQGVLRVFFIFVIPSLAVGGLPIETVGQSSWIWYAVIWGLAFFWMALAHLLLHRAIRFYESGNLIGARL